MPPALSRAGGRVRACMPRLRSVAWAAAHACMRVARSMRVHAHHVDCIESSLVLVMYWFMRGQFNAFELIPY